MSLLLGPKMAASQHTAYGIKNVSSSFFLSLFCILDLSHLTGFVNAQYRFVMNPNGDYTVHFADPDMSVPCRDHLKQLTIACS